MASQEFASEQTEESKKKRVVELEINLPKIKTKPVKDAAKAVLLTGIGLGALTVRGVKGAVKAAHKAGTEAAEHPDPATRLLLRLMGEKATAESEEPPIEDYDNLAATDVLEHLDELDSDQLHVLRAYESAGKERVTVLRAIDERLGEKEPSQE